MYNCFDNVTAWVEDPVDITRVSCLMTTNCPVYTAEMGHICETCYLLLDDEHRVDFKLGMWHSMVLNELAKEKAQCYLCDDPILSVTPCINCDMCVDESKTISSEWMEDDGEIELSYPSQI